MIRTQEAKSRTSPCTQQHGADEKGQQRPSCWARAPVHPWPRRSPADPAISSAKPEKAAHFPKTASEELTRESSSRPRNRRKQPSLSPKSIVLMYSADRHARPHTCTISHPSAGHLAHKIDLGEIIQFHFTFSCSGTLPAATSVLPEVRKLWTRQSPAVVNGTPYSLYEFPVNLQITSNTTALHRDSVLRPHVYLPPISDYLPAADSSSQGPSGCLRQQACMQTGQGAPAAAGSQQAC